MLIVFSEEEIDFLKTMLSLRVDFMCLFDLRGLPLISAWISNHTPSNFWDEITYHFQTSSLAHLNIRNGQTIINIILQNGYNYSCTLGYTLTHIGKRAPGWRINNFILEKMAYRIIHAKRAWKWLFQVKLIVLTCLIALRCFFVIFCLAISHKDTYNFIVYILLSILLHEAKVKGDYSNFIPLK